MVELTEYCPRVGWPSGLEFNIPNPISSNSKTENDFIFIFYGTTYRYISDSKVFDQITPEITPEIITPK